MDQDLRSRIQAAAQERGLDPEIAVNFAKAESSLDPNAKAKTSSARGLFQVIDRTWKEYGGGDKKDINEQIRVGTDVIASNQASFKRKFNREPSAAELYAYHVLGPTGAPPLLRADPATPMEQIVSREAIKANPNWRGKTAGDVLGTYEKKVGGSPTPRIATQQTKPGMRPTNYSFEPLTQLDIENLGPGYQAGMAAMALADTQDNDEDNIAERAQEAKDDAENSMLADQGSRNVANLEFSYASPFPQEAPVQMAKGGEARKMMDAVYRADGSPEYGEISMGDFSGTVNTGDARQQLKNFATQGWKAPTRQDAKRLAQIPVEGLSNLESAARGSVASEIGGFGDIEAAFRNPRADSQAFPTRSGIQGRKETVLPQTQDVLDAMPRKLLPSNERTEGFEEVGTYVGLGPAGYALSKVPAAYRAAAPVVGAAVAKGAEKVKSVLKPAERVAPPVTSTPTERPPFSFLLDHPEYLDPIEIVPTGPTAVRGNAVADVAAPPSPMFSENLGVSRYLMPKDFVGGKAVALDTPYPHFVSKLDQFTAALPGAVTKSQYLGSLKGKFRDYEILRAEEALAGLDANAKLKPADIAEKLKNVTPVDRLKTYIDEPSNSMPHREYDNPHYDKPVGIVNLMTDIPEAQRGTAEEALVIKRAIESISVGNATDRHFNVAMNHVNNSDMAPKLKARTLSALEDARIMTDGLRQDTAKINGLLDDLVIPFHRRQDEYEKLIASLKKKEKLSQYDAMDKATRIMRADAAEVLRKEGYPVPSTIDQMGLVSTDSEEWKALQKAQDKIRGRFNLDQVAKKGDIANRFHDSNKGDSLFNQIENHLTRKFMYEGQHPSLSKQGEVPVGFSRFVDNVVDIPGRGKTDVMHVLDLQSDLYDDLVKHGGKHTSPQKDSKERAQLTSKLTDILEKASDRQDALKTPRSVDFFKDIPDYLNDALAAAKEKYNRQGAISPYDPEIADIKDAFNLTDNELMDVVKGIQRQTVLAGRVERSAEWSKNVSEHSYNIDQVFPGMEKSPQVVQQMLVKNAVMGALRRGKQGITFPGAESNQAQLYEKLPNNLRQVVKDLGPGFELVPNIVQDTAGKGQISNWGIVWDPETAQNVLRAGVRFNKGGSVEKNYDDNRRFL
jgi:hypothetical protein